MKITHSFGFIIVLLISQALGITMFALGIWWPLIKLNGFAWDGSSKQFDVHPFCMVCGFVLFYGEATLVFRVFSGSSKQCVKILHGTLQLVAFIAAVVGLQAVFDFHNQNGSKNVYTLHSWSGMMTMILFGLQYVLGFFTFFWPGLATHIREIYMPVHKYFGLATLFLAAVAVISGITEDLLLKFSSTYSQLPSGALTGNCLGLVLLGYVVTVGFLLNNPNWVRRESTEGQPLLSDGR